MITPWLCMADLQVYRGKAFTFHTRLAPMETSAYKTRITAILRQVRDIVLPFYGQVPTWRNKEASAADVVTELDVRVEAFLAEELRKAYPSIGFVGEETGGIARPNASG